MTSAIDRNTLAFFPDIENEDWFPEEQYILDPELYGVEAYEPKYWRIEGDSVILMTESERNAVDTAARLRDKQTGEDFFEFSVQDNKRWQFFKKRINFKVPFDHIPEVEITDVEFDGAIDTQVISKDKNYFEIGIRLRAKKNISLKINWGAW